MNLFSRRVRFHIFFFLLGFSALASFARAVDTPIGGDITGPLTLYYNSSPYVVTSNIRVGGDNGLNPPTYAKLTIEPGVVVKVNSGVSITVGYFNSSNGKEYRGSIQANGTSALPIQFIASTGTSQGYWGGITLSMYQAEQSQFSYVSIKNATTGLTTGASSQYQTGMPLLHHTTFEQNTKGMAINSSANQLNIYQVNFISNGTGTNNYGLTNTSTNPPTVARFCWWNSATGPSLTGGGTAQRVSSNVIYEPYLTNLASNIHYFIGGAVINKTFNPNISANLRLQFQTIPSGNWTVTFYDAGSQLVRTITGSGSNMDVAWDGKNSGGTLLPNGNYTYKIDSIAGSDVATQGAGPTILDTTKLLSITSFTSNVSVGNSFNFNGSANFDDPAWTLRVKNSSNVVVRTATGANSPMSFTWNGKDDSNNQVPDGDYTAELQFAYGGVIATSTVNIAVDTTPPSIVINSPTNGQVLSNVYNNGSFDFPVNITVSDLHLTSWTLQSRRTLPSTTPLTTVASGTTAKNNATVYTFQTFVLTNAEQYEFRLTAVDGAGNSVTISNFVTIGNFKLTMNVTQFNPSQNASVTFTSIVPFDLSQTILIKNLSGQTVKTLIQNASRSAGNWNDIWDGRNGSAQLVPDGAYFYVAQLTVNSTQYTMDFTNTFPNTNPTKLTSTVSPTNDPFNNLALNVNYTVPQPSRILICFSSAPTNDFVCDPPSSYEFQAVQFEYQASGAQTYQWIGLDLNGVLQPQKNKVVVAWYPGAINSVFVIGTKPVISAFTLTPTLFSPFRQNQSLSVTFSTYQSQSATVTATFKNQQSQSILRTIILNGVTPGQTNISWNGRSDNGMWVSPGVYIVTITVQDSLGNIASRQLLTTVRY